MSVCLSWCTRFQQWFWRPLIHQGCFSLAEQYHTQFYKFSLNNEDSLKIEDDLKNEDNLKNEDDLKNEDKLKRINDFKKKDDL